MLARFVDRAPVARGGAGAVERALDERTGQRVALKRCHAVEGPAADAVAREGALLSVLSHPALARYVLHGRLDDGTPFVVTEWIDGPSLEARASGGPALTIEQCIRVAIRLASALSVLHEAGFAHGDVSPSNVLLAEGESARATLIDPASQGFATPGFAAPEVLRGAPSTPSSDVFALGAVLRSALDPSAPWPEALSALLAAMTDPRASARPRAASVLAALERVELSLEGAGPAMEGARASLAPSPSVEDEALPVRGRSVELAWLDREAAHACTAGPRVAVLRATVGMGKSSLLRHWLATRAETAGFARRWSLVARASSGPFSLLEALLLAALDERAAEPDPMRAMVAACGSAAERATIEALFCEVLRRPMRGGVPPLVAVARTDAGIMAAQLEWAFARMLTAACAQAPLALAIDDAQQVDAVSSRVLAGALRSVSGPLFIVLAARSTAQGGEGPLLARGDASLTLSGLSPAAAELVVRALWPDITAAALRALLARAEGCPLFLEQLARAKESSRTTDPAGIVVGDVIRARVESRLPLERTVLAAVALLGASFTAGEASAVCAGVASEGAVHLALERLREAGMLREAGRGVLTFPHDLLRDAALRSGDADRGDLRARALRWLSARGEEDAALAALADRAGELGEASLRYLSAARRATTGGDFASAREYAERGLRAATSSQVRAALRAVLANALGSLGQWEDASSFALRALSDLHRGTTDWVRAASARCFGAFELGRLEEFASLVDELTAIDPDESAADLLAWSFAVNAFALATAYCDPSSCERLRSAATALADRFPTARIRAAAARVRADVARGLDGALGPAMDAITESERHYDDAGDALGALYPQGIRARYLIVAGDPRAALEVLSASIQRAERLRAASALVYMRVSLAEALLALGRTSDALSEVQSVLELPGVGARVALRAQALRIAGEVHLALGDIEESARCADESARSWRFACAERAAAWGVLARARLAAGDVVAAVSAAREAVATVSSERPLCHDEHGARATLALALARSGPAHREEALFVLADARERLDAWSARGGSLSSVMSSRSSVALRTQEALSALASSRR